ncbi:MAG: hypothetical protein ACFBSC_21800 [Microcoleaceae cyanobacterium]
MQQITRLIFVLTTGLISSLALGLSYPAMAQLRPNRPTFFEEGERQLQREIDRLNQPQESEPILTIDDDVTGESLIQLPGDVAVVTDRSDWKQRQETIQLPSGEIQMNLVTTSDTGLRLILGYSEPLSSRQTESPNDLFDQVQAVIESDLQSQAVTQNRLQQLNQRPIRLDANPGREISFARPNHLIRCRLYLINQRVYLLLASSERGIDQARQTADNFLNSFRVLSQTDQ